MIKVENLTVATRMATYAGQHFLGEYCEEKELWSNYQERLEQYIVLHKVPDDSKVPLLISYMGA